MKPRSEVDLGLKAYLQWVSFCFGGCRLGFRKEERWFVGAASRPLDRAPRLWFPVACAVLRVTIQPSGLDSEMKAPSVSLTTVPRSFETTKLFITIVLCVFSFDLISVVPLLFANSLDIPTTLAYSGLVQHSYNEAKMAQ